MWTLACTRKGLGLGLALCICVDGNHPTSACFTHLGAASMCAPIILFTRALIFFQERARLRSNEQLQCRRPFPFGYCIPCTARTAQGDNTPDCSVDCRSTLLVGHSSKLRLLIRPAARISTKFFSHTPRFVANHPSAAMSVPMPSKKGNAVREGQSRGSREGVKRSGRCHASNANPRIFISTPNSRKRKGGGEVLRSPHETNRGT